MSNATGARSLAPSPPSSWVPDLSRAAMLPLSFLSLFLFLTLWFPPPNSSYLKYFVFQSAPPRTRAIHLDLLRNDASAFVSIRYKISIALFSATQLAPLPLLALFILLLLFYRNNVCIALSLSHQLHLLTPLDIIIATWVETKHRHIYSFSYFHLRIARRETALPTL